MEFSAKEIIRTLLSREKFKQKDLAPIMTEKIGKKYTAGSLTQKLIRNTITYDEFVVIADILGYDVKIERREQQ